MKIFLYLMVASSFVAADLFSINMKIMELSLFRISLLGITFIVLLEYLKTNRKIRIRPQNNHSTIIKFYLMWFIYSLFSLGWVKDYYSWVRAIFFLGSGFLCIWILSTYLKKQKDFEKVFLIILVMVILHNIIGWSEILTGNYKFADLTRIDKYNQFSYNPSARVPISMFYNVNDYATLLVIGFFISYISFSNSTNKIIKILSIFNFISSMLLILRTGSRANMLGLIIGIVVIFYLKYLKRISIRTILIFTSIPIVILLNPKMIDLIIGTALEKLKFDFSIGSDFIRLNLIKNGLYFLKETIGFGTGAGNIEYWMETERMYYVGNIRNMHNWWAEILVGYGIYIFIGYVWVYIKKVKILYSSFLNISNSFIQNTSLGLLAAMSGFIVTSISSSSIMSAEWLWLFWGVVIAYIGYVEGYAQAKDNINNLKKFDEEDIYA